MLRHVLFSLLLLLLLAAAMPGQEYNNFGAAGISYNPGAQPAIAGTGLYARLIAGTGTYAFSAVDALPISRTPFTVSTQFSAGIAQKILTLNGISIYVPTSAGISYNGTNTGWAWTTGALAPIPLRKDSAWRIAPHVRMVKSSVNDQAGYQIIAGLLVGWTW